MIGTASYSVENVNDRPRPRCPMPKDLVGECFTRGLSTSAFSAYWLSLESRTSLRPVPRSLSNRLVRTKPLSTAKRPDLHSLVGVRHTLCEGLASQTQVELCCNTRV